MSPLSPLDTRQLRQALGRFVTGVTIVTCRDTDGQPVGLTVNSLSALSLEPPLVSWALRTASPSSAAFRAATHFAINVLGEGQVELSRRFASPVADKFCAGQWVDGMAGAPVLSGCCALIECRRHDVREYGDHWLVVGEVVGLHDAPLAPLLFQSGHYRLLGKIL